MEAFSRGVTLARRQGLQGGSIPFSFPLAGRFRPASCGQQAKPAPRPPGGTTMFLWQ